jgi:hypothetical protein
VERRRGKMMAKESLLFRHFVLVLFELRLKFWEEDCFLHKVFLSEFLNVVEKGFLY